MSAVSDRDAMVAGMAPVVRQGRYVFVSVNDLPSADVDPLMVFHEDEGITLIVRQREADRLGLAYDLVLGWITLTVHSALDGVGLTAAVSTVLAEAGIACNMVAAARHDHVFVPVQRMEDAMRALEDLAASTRAAGLG
ncbi:MAG: ACT domain-containing protein [Actinomycetales bacterium]|nr:ACT domain-containing protein [Actinomycetales bacterium]